MNARPQPAAHSLARYYALTATNSVAITMIFATIFFWTRSAFHYSNTENLWLGVCFGLTGIPGSRYGGRLADRIGPDRLLLAVFSANALLLLTGWLAPWHYAPFILALIYGLLVNACWPALEVAIFEVNSRLSTAKRLSIYNITWSIANTFGLLASSLFVGWMPSVVVWGPGLLYAATTLLIPKPSPLTHSLSTSSIPIPSTTVAPEHKQRFMHAAWLGNALSYVMIAVLLPLLPALGDRLGQSPSLTVILAGAFYLTRALSFVLYGRWEGWHYHRGWNMMALAMAPLAFAGVMLTSSPPLILVSLAVFGASLGLVYSCSLFYSLDYNTAKGEYGGLHEAIIGIGNLGGPLVGLAGVRWIGDPHGAALATLAVVAVGTLIAISLLPPRSGIPSNAAPSTPTPTHTLTPADAARSPLPPYKSNPPLCSSHDRRSVPDDGKCASR